MLFAEPSSLSSRLRALFCSQRGKEHVAWRQDYGSLLLGCLLAAGLLGACTKTADSAAPSTQKAAQVGVITLKKQSQQLDVSLPGRTRAFLTAEVRPQVSGILQKRLFTEGAVVRQGQPLYQIDAAMLSAAEASAQAALARAQASARTLASTAQRNAELVKIHAVSQQVHEESQAAAAQARSDVAVAQASLDSARINLKYSRIEAPISGRISLSNVTPGALVTANQADALTSIVQLDPMYVDFTQSSSELVALKRDWEAGRFQRIDGNKLPVRIRLDDGSDYAHAGLLQFSGMIVNPSTGSVTLRAEVPNPEGLLMPGMYVQALLPTGLAPEALLIPQRAVTRDLTGRASVFVIGEDGVVESRPVEIERAVGNQWLIESGLNAGERVMVDGFQRVKPGDKATPLELELQAGTGAKPGAGGQPAAAPAAGDDKAPARVATAR